MTIKAFPITLQNEGINLGMDLRDYFAAAAMQGLYSDDTLDITTHEAAIYAYEIADAMMEARK
jgi:hypothetical protein